MVFSQEEIANMDKEVDEDMSDIEDMFNDSDEEQSNRKREFDSDSNDVYGNDCKYAQVKDICKFAVP